MFTCFKTFRQSHGVPVQPPKVYAYVHACAGMLALHLVLSNADISPVFRVNVALASTRSKNMGFDEAERTRGQDGHETKCQEKGWKDA